MRKSSFSSVASREADIERQIGKLEGMSLLQLRDAWFERFGAQAPKLKGRDLLLRVLAWQIQAQQFGALPSRIERRLMDLKAAFANDPHYAPAPLLSLLPGSVLVREWKGVTHRVLVEQTGFMHEEKRYSSLTDVARTITGTAWSGPRFFGLERKAKELGKRP